VGDEREAPTSLLLRSLATEDRENRSARKRLVGPDINYGRECLLALARQTGGWVGWEAANLRGIAEELAFLPLAEQRKHIASDIEVGALINRALAAALDENRLRAPTRALQGSLGFRQALRDAVLELRTAGISADALRAAASGDSAAHDVAAVLEIYERLLEEQRIVDPAGLFVAALDAFDREADFVLDGLTLLSPGIIARGLPRLLVDRLLSRGARVLAADIPIEVPTPAVLLVRGSAAVERGSSLAWVAASGVPAVDDLRVDASVCDVDFFNASTPSTELREVCRRIVAEGLSWDEVEIVATDVDGYGIALDALCESAGIGATMLHGIPLARTRLGRALTRWLSWLEQGLPADVLRQSLEAGELTIPGTTHLSTALARELRALEIGWGRARYEATLEAIAEGRKPVDGGAHDGESKEEHEIRRATRRQTVELLATFLTTLLGATPAVPERGATEHIEASCASLARATLGWLALVPTHDAAEEQTATRLRTRLDGLASIDDERRSFASAIAELRDSLAELRAWPLVTSERQPWSSAGKMLHLTDVAHAGTTGRKRVFVVGLDADRTSGPAHQDPLLPDALKSRLAHDALTTTPERRQLSAYQLAMALSSLRGRVTLSYSLTANRDGQQASPAAELLQAYRIAHTDATVSYESLRKALAPPASAVVTRDESGALRGAELLDARDVWLDALADGPLLLDGDALVRGAHPMLDAGLESGVAYTGSVLTPYHGIVAGAAGIFDPTERAGSAISPSSFEMLSACPLKWFYHYALALRPSLEPEFDPDRWLDAAQRGNLLHALFERFVEEYLGRQEEIHDDSAKTAILAMADTLIAHYRRELPPPGESVFESEVRELHDSALAFLQMERQHSSGASAGHWAHVELEFGARDAGSVFPIDAQTLVHIKGRIDRVDELDDGSLRVVDYKTGMPTKFRKSSKTGAFNGGRLLQPAVYAAAIRERFAKMVTRFEYRFPTERGKNEVVAFNAAELESAAALVPDLLGYIRSGTFVSTNDESDCRYCDYRANCRAPEKGMPLRVRWAQEHSDTLEQYRAMLARRAKGIK